MTDTSRSFVEEARREKLAALRERGVDPFAYAFDRSHSAAEALAAFDPDEETRVRFAGRVVSRRGHGKTTFMHLEDASGRLQVYLKRDIVGEDAYEVVKLTDLGDFIGVEGHMFRTRTGEVTVHVDAVALLTKAVRPLPVGKEDAEGEQHGALTDAEQRARERYADLAVHAEVRDTFRLRARVVQLIRRHLDDAGYLEVETPVLQPLYGGALARPFQTHFHALDATFYLRIATELYLKRCIVGGLERVYEIGKDFRNEGIDRLHNPEFTMLEFYGAYIDYEEVMEILEAMVHDVVVDVAGATRIERFGTTFDFGRPWRRVTYEALLQEHAGVDLSADDEALRSVLTAREVPDVETMTRGKLLDEVFKVCVEPTLVQPTLVVDYPMEISPLAKVKRGDDRLVERFELFVAGKELANAFSELNDPDEQLRRFEAQGAARAAGDDEAHTVDRDYVRALEYGMPPTGGCGLGIDRLVMLLAEQRSIREVILFPMLRPET
jgi:lysyl-tRNA synthetase class 2